MIVQGRFSPPGRRSAGRALPAAKIRPAFPIAEDSVRRRRLVGKGESLPMRLAGGSWDLPGPNQKVGRQFERGVHFGELDLLTVRWRDDGGLAPLPGFIALSRSFVPIGLVPRRGRSLSSGGF
jgi:hypothetical protein